MICTWTTVSICPCGQRLAPVICYFPPSSTEVTVLFLSTWNLCKMQEGTKKNMSCPCWFLRNGKVLANITIREVLNKNILIIKWRTRQNQWNQDERIECRFSVFVMFFFSDLWWLLHQKRQTDIGSIHTGCKSQSSRTKGKEETRRSRRWGTRTRIWRRGSNLWKIYHLCLSKVTEFNLLAWPLEMLQWMWPSAKGLVSHH